MRGSAAPGTYPGMVCNKHKMILRTSSFQTAALPHKGLLLGVLLGTIWCGATPTAASQVPELDLAKWNQAYRIIYANISEEEARWESSSSLVP